MPFVSQKQRKLMYAKASRGEISKKTVEEFEAATPKNKKLPEYVSSRKPERKSLKDLMKRK